MTNRKLQGEIERCLKKVTEGIEIFEELYDKIYQTNNHSQKEKIEAELKKEIKKLQRLRDQIKTWQSSSEIKDKKQLIDARKLIETQMEKFKACEREMKTKQYSKEGLLAKEKVDPAEIAKTESANWITNMVEKLNTQVDVLEAESEQIKATKGRRGVKVDTDRLSEIEHHLERHKFHMAKLENMLRNLENEGISVDDVESVKDMVEYYVDSNQEPDFLEDEEIYDHLNLIDDELVGVLDEHTNSGSGTAQGSQESINIVKEEEKEEEKKKASPKEEPPVDKKLPKIVKKTSVPEIKSTTVKPTTPSAPSSLPPAPPPVAPAKPPIKYATVIASSSNSSPSTVSNAVSSSNSASTDKNTTPQSSTSSGPTSSTVKLVSKLPAPSIAEAASVPKPEVSSHINTEVIDTKTTSSPVNVDNNTPNFSKFPKSFSDLISTFEANRKRTYGIGDEMLRNQYLIHLMNVAFQQCPDITDSERPPVETQVGKQPSKFVSPKYYPQAVPVSLYSPAMFERLDLDTLFFIFYYQQGTRAQYLAARELKRQSWRFHKKYMTWFQRHEEPRAITDEYEQGTYVYFDFEGTWCQRKKSEFTFEYRFLEGE